MQLYTHYTDEFIFFVETTENPMHTVLKVAYRQCGALQQGQDSNVHGNCLESFHSLLRSGCAYQ